jgi:translation initiation factor 4G
MYAQLCKRLEEHAPNFESPDTKITTFKRLLLNKCRDEFENRAAVSGAYEKRAGSLTTEEEEARFIAKRKMLGNIKFIGELGKLEMLHDSILHRCCEQLLVGRKRQPISEQGEDLECMAYLFKTCGRILDTQKAKLLMDQYFDRIRGIIAHVDSPTRIKFLLQDVIEMRENKWMPRKLATHDGPRTIQQVREDAARDGCIYLPQHDNNMVQKTNSPSRLQEVLFSKSRNKGMEDIFGGPGFQGSSSLGTGPGVIGGETDGYGYEPYRNGSSFEEKFNANNSAYNRDESRDHRDFKPKRDGFESKFAERPDFGDRFTANRNKTHPSNRGGRVRMDGGGMTRSNGYEKNGNSHHNGEQDLPPRFNKMGFRDQRDQLPLRPSANSMMLKPKTPSSLPKSAMQRMENGMMQNMSTPKVMMSTSEPAVFISKQSVDKKRQEKKNQGPTREEVFKKIEEILVKLAETESTNEAFTTWKEADIPNKMVNNALIHFFKQVVKMSEKTTRNLALQLVDQLCESEVVTQVQCKEAILP